MDTNTLNKAKELIGKIESLNDELSSLFKGVASPGVATIHLKMVDPVPRSEVRQGRRAPTALELTAAKKTKKTRNMTPEGRAAISAAAKKRWAAFKKAKKAAKIA